MKLYCTYCQKEIEGDYKNCPECHSILTMKKESWTGVTKQQFKAYEEVRRSGFYNMITDAEKVMKHTGLDKKTYIAIIENYATLKALYKNII